MIAQTPKSTATRLSEGNFYDMDAYWRAVNYLTVGQIYLLDNPLLREPLRLEHVKPRLLGHWGTSPGLSFIYAHLNRIIRARDVDVIYVCGPGHGGPAVVANTYLEGTYSELYPDVALNEEGMRKLFRQFSFPDGVPSHAAPDVPGSIMREENSVTHCRMPMVRPSTIRISLSPVSSVTVKRKQARWRRRGIPTSFSIRGAMARCCLSCISTATRSLIRPFWPAFRMTNCGHCSSAMVTNRSSSRVPIQRRCMSGWLWYWMMLWIESAPSRAPRAMGSPSCPHARNGQ